VASGRTSLNRLPPPSRRRAPPSAGSLARRRILVAVAKRLLPLSALGLLAAIALWPEFESAAERGRVAFRRVAEVRPDALLIVNPRYQGADEQNRPYNVTADRALQSGSEEVVQLEAPRADLLLADGGWVYVEAREGRYDKAASRLDLAGQVTIHHDDGTQFVTARAAMDVERGHAEGDDPVAAQGPFGTLTAEGFRLRDRGQVVVFTGRARAVLEGTP
jgi:lipopolysaccharide export system protein LptC